MVFDERTLKRFWSKVDTSGGLEACWPWKEYTNADGYGCFKLRTRKSVYSHRFALCTRIPVDGIQHALHSCDNPPCCNPAHLRWGSNKDNMRDRNERNSNWLKNVSSAARSNGPRDRKLTMHQANQIRELVGLGKTQKDCAIEYGVSKNIVSRICRNLRYIEEIPNHPTALHQAKLIMGEE